MKLMICTTSPFRMMEQRPNSIDSFQNRKEGCVSLNPQRLTTSYQIKPRLGLSPLFLCMGGKTDTTHVLNNNEINHTKTLKKVRAMTFNLCTKMTLPNYGQK